MRDTALVNRDTYLNRALMFRDTDLIKVITGVRRCGKSSLLALVRNKIASEGVDERSLVSLNLESKACPVSTEDELYAYFKDRLDPDGRTYIFLDEPQRIEGWQTAVNAMRVDFDCDIYLTGSNAYLLSSELSTYLSGRYVEIKMMPLAVSEYLDFCGLSFGDSSAAIGPDGNVALFDDMLERYLRYGGMPAIASLSTTQEMHSTYFSGLYDAVVSRDILNRERARGRSKVTDMVLLEKIAVFLGDNVGNSLSIKSIADTLTSAGSKTTNKTVESYVAALNEAYLFYKADRYDLHGKEILRTSPKQYIVDLGLRSYLGGYRACDMGRLFENAVYMELLFRGWRVHVGKLYGKEIDFVAVKDGRTIYLQVTDEMHSETTRNRELAPFQSIRDAYEKAVVVRQGTYEPDIDGIRIVPAKDFFLEKAF